MTITKTHDIKRLTDIMMSPEIRELYHLPDGWDFSYLYNENADYLMFEEDGVDLGFIWLEDDEDGRRSHIMMTKKCRGSKALKAIRGAINWVFTHTDTEVVWAKPPVKTSYVLCKMLGFKDVREYDETLPFLGVVHRYVVTLSKKDWFKKLLSVPFFVTGYPRSGTAWFANFLTCTPAYCLHEGTLLGPQVGLWLLEGKFKGLSDSMLLNTKLIDENPDSPVVLIDRNRREAQESLAKFSGQPVEVFDTVFDILESRMDWLRNRPKTLVIPFKDFTKHAPDVWAHLLPTIPYDTLRGKFLSDFNVQQDLHKILALGPVNPLDEALNPLLKNDYTEQLRLS